MTTPDNFAVQRIDGVLILTLRHDVFDPIDVEQLSLQVGRVLEHEASPRVVLNFEHVTLMSSRFLGVLMSIHLKVSQKHGQLRLCSIRPHLRDVFTVMRLDQILRIEPSCEAAVKGF